MIGIHMKYNILNNIDQCDKDILSRKSIIYGGKHSVFFSLDASVSEMAQIVNAISFICLDESKKMAIYMHVAIGHSVGHLKTEDVLHPYKEEEILSQSVESILGVHRDRFDLIKEWMDDTRRP